MSNEKRYGRLKHWFQSTIKGEARLIKASHRIGLQQIDAGLILAGKYGTLQVWIKFTVFGVDRTEKGGSLGKPPASPAFLPSRASSSTR